MNYKYNCGIYIGRFQPFHKGHLHIVEQMMKECRKVVVVIGSANKGNTERNPLTYYERKTIIDKVIGDLGYQYRVNVVGIDDRKDISNDSSWGEYVKEQLSLQGIEFDAIYEGYELERVYWYSTLNIPVTWLDRVFDISATKVREALKQDNRELYEKYMPESLHKDFDNLRYLINNTRRERIVQWIREYFADNREGKAIIGISGGKDSTIAAALCVEALGADRVIGVLMPNMVQNDIYDSYEVVSRLQIQYHVVNIGAVCNELYRSLSDAVFLSGGIKAVKSNTMITTNIPARLRMTALYAIAALYPNSRVCGTSNLSEITVGYCTKGGDTVNDFAPLANCTVEEVYQVGEEYIQQGKLPKRLVYKTPSDGMSGMSDEEKMGVPYDAIDKSINNRYVGEKEARIIRDMNIKTRHKFELSPRPPRMHEQLKVTDAHTTELNNIISSLLEELRNYENNH